jgi:hypothetical protein
VKQEAFPGHAIAEAHSTTAQVASADILSPAEAPPMSIVPQRSAPHPQANARMNVDSVTPTAPAAKGAAQAHAGSPLSFDNTHAPSRSRQNPVTRTDAAPVPPPLLRQQGANLVAPREDTQEQGQNIAARTHTHREPHETRAGSADKDSGNPPVPAPVTMPVSSARVTALMPAHRSVHSRKGLSVPAPIPLTSDRPSATGPEQAPVRAYPPALRAPDAEGAAPVSRQDSRRSPAPASELRIDIGRIDIGIPRSRSSARRPMPPPLKTRTRGGPDS